MPPLTLAAILKHLLLICFPTVAYMGFWGVFTITAFIYSTFFCSCKNGNTHTMIALALLPRLFHFPPCVGVRSDLSDKGQLVWFSLS